ncbi:hypothetical protein NP493_536g01001 [Ridgeia piscesae]|uniref:Peptidase S9 prolyl oligopeptidase catalytic domain-containing protein n=1 Tax=Ridgeia piscesae TaxID=27915 RepID=A0AAD9NS31_RIDPI|nr:hypothetical protein NP493_536g01001 [Ridgeia piscesae]
MTCDLGEDCQYVSVSFGYNCEFYILHCLGPGVPYSILRSTRTDLNMVLEDNADLKEHLEQKAISKPEYSLVDTHDGAKVWVRVFLPPTLNKEHIVIYPLLVHVYGGPGSQQVTFRFRLGWDAYLSSSQKIIIVQVDGRGSGARGQKYLHSIYKQLGTLEVQDQITAVRNLTNTYPFIDKERCAIWGWSYGGFVTSHVMGDPSKVITCGIAVAPVTDWRYYDSAYSEKYMGLAADNFRGYDNANVSRKAANIRGKNLMLIHGTADDNVHFQHTAQFIRALMEADVDFRVHVYTDKKHSIAGGNTRKHLYRTMTRYLQRHCWNGGVPRDRTKS